MHLPINKKSPPKTNAKTENARPALPQGDKGVEDSHQIPIEVSAVVRKSHDTVPATQHPKAAIPNIIGMKCKHLLYEIVNEQEVSLKSKYGTSRVCKQITR